MKFDHHHIAVGLERISDDIFLLKLDVSGKLSHEDYEIFVPMLEAALETVKKPKIRFFLDATDLDGWEPRAAWDDLRLGIKHGKVLDKVAVFGNRKWQELSAKVGGWFISGEVKYFENRGEALEWVKQ